jgi:dipeptidyl aminopeptidase/acylaminoacyl peptidase
MNDEELEFSVAKMAKIGFSFSPSFSPDGSQIAFISNLSGVPQIWIVSSNGGWPHLVTAFDDPILSVSWSPVGEWLAFSLAPGGGMNQQVYLVRPDGTDLRLLTDGGKENNWLYNWTYEGKFLKISSNRHNPKSMDAYLYDTLYEEWILVAKNPGVGNIVDVSLDNKYATINRRLQRGNNNLYLVDIEKNKEILLTPHEGPAEFRGGRFSADAKTVYISSNADREFLGFGRITIDEKGQPSPIEIIIDRENSDLQGIRLTDDKTLAALIWNVGGYNEIDFYNLTSLTLIRGPKIPTEIFSDAIFSKDGSLFAMVLSGSTRPVDIYMYKIKTTELAQITYSPHAGVDLSKLIQPELLRFQAHDGLELSGWLYLPKNVVKPCPVVLKFHGGPEAQERPIFYVNYQALLTQDITVFAPNVRGSEGFGKTFINLDNGKLRFNAVQDIKACVDFLITSNIADPQRIGIMGPSYGGYMTMAGLTEYPELFTAGANLFGVVNFETFFENTEPWMAEISKIEYGDPETQRDLLKALSPIHKLDGVTAPTIVLHGANDTNVPVVEPEQVVENLKKRGIIVKYSHFPDEGHCFATTKNRITSTVEIVKWFVKYLIFGS